MSSIWMGVFASLYMRQHPSSLVLTNQYMRPHPYITSNITKPLWHLFHNQLVSISNTIFCILQQYFYLVNEGACNTKIDIKADGWFEILPPRGIEFKSFICIPVLPCWVESDFKFKFKFAAQSCLGLSLILNFNLNLNLHPCLGLLGGVQF